MVEADVQEGSGIVRVVMHSAGVSLLLVSEDGQLPWVVHWGADVGELDRDGFDALVDVSRFSIAPSSIDQAQVVGLLPEAGLGYLGKPGLIGSRDGEDWSIQWQLDHVVIDSLAAQDDFVALGAGVVEFHATGGGLGLVLTVEMLPEGLVRTRAELSNRGVTAFDVQELTLALPVPARATEILDFAGRWGKERVPQRSQLTLGQHRREGRHGRTGFDSAYVLNLGTAGFGFGSGEVWGLHVAWSGNHVHFAERELAGSQVIGGGELLLAGEGKLSPGQSYSTPWIFGNYAVGLDAQAARFHRYLRGLPVAPGPDRPVSLNVWEAVYFDHDLPRLIELADIAAQVGIERYVLDDGWFGARRNDHAGLGDWVVSPDVWPDGLSPLIDHVKARGMQFGLWFEPEMVNEDSDVARAHPEWIMQPAGRLPLPSRHQQVLNLSIEGAFQHVKSQISEILDDYDIDYVKWDHNRDLIEAGTAPEGKAAVAAHTRAFYRLLDELREAHPGVEFESCSSGGGRIDLEVMQRAERVWVSDNSDPEDRQQMLSWTGQLLPPEVMGSHIAAGHSHTTLRSHSLHFRAATAVFGHLGVEWDLTRVSEEERAQLAEWIEWYKANRDVLLSGRVYRVDMPQPDVHIKGVVAERKAIFSLAMLSISPCAHLGQIRFPGLEPATRYRVKIRDPQHQPGVLQLGWMRSGGVVLSGAQLGTVGIQAPILYPCTAVLFELEPVR